MALVHEDQGEVEVEGKVEVEGEVEVEEEIEGKVEGEGEGKGGGEIGECTRLGLYRPWRGLSLPVPVR